MGPVLVERERTVTCATIVRADVAEVAGEARDQGVGQSAVGVRADGGSWSNPATEKIITGGVPPSGHQANRLSQSLSRSQWRVTQTRASAPSSAALSRSRCATFSAHR